MQRPHLDNNISLTDFEEFYWLKEELVEFCKKIGIPTGGSKLELTNKIRHYFSTGKLVVNVKKTQTVLSTFDWNKEPLNSMTIITDSYKNTENVRTFFTGEIGSNFSFNVKFMK